VKVFEKAPQLKSGVGAGFGVTNGGVVLKHELGINLSEISTPFNKFHFSTPLGFELGTVDFKKEVLRPSTLFNWAVGKMGSL
jgi:hypothetical protein